MKPRETRSASRLSGWQGVALAALLVLGLFVAAQLRFAGARAEPADRTPVSDGARYKVPVSLSQPSLGPSNAQVTIVEWCDATGHACRQSRAVLATLRHRYGGKLRHVFRHYVAERTPEALLPHELLRVAAEQGDRFWEARDLMLAHAQFSRADVDAFVVELGLEPNAARAALDRHSYAGHIAADDMFAHKFGVTGAPSLFVNGRRFVGALTEARLARLIDRELSHAEALRRAGTPADRLYDAITEEGRWALAPAGNLASAP